MQRIYITGCAGTGTTLVQRLFSAFAGVEVLWGETDLESYVQYEPPGTCVAKRTAHTIFSHCVSTEKLDRHLYLLSRHPIYVVNCERSGARFGYSGRWRASVEQASVYAGYITARIAYEDLIREPNDVQQRIASVFDLDIEHYWSEYPDFVPAAGFDYLPEARFPRHRARKIGEAV